MEGIKSKRSSGGGEGEPREMNQRGVVEGLGALVARPVGASIVLDAGTEMEAINDLENGFRWATRGACGSGGADEIALSRWFAMMRGVPVGGYLLRSRLKATRCCV